MGQKGTWKPPWKGPPCLRPRCPEPISPISGLFGPQIFRQSPPDSASGYFSSDDALWPLDIHALLGPVIRLSCPAEGPPPVLLVSARGTAIYMSFDTRPAGRPHWAGWLTNSLTSLSLNCFSRRKGPTQCMLTVRAPHARSAGPKLTGSSRREGHNMASRCSVPGPALPSVSWGARQSQIARCSG